ncbi:ATP-binding protein, partial [Pyramidobacter porci]
MNLARGCGLWGVAGMPERRGMYIRPLLSFRREELRDFLRAQGWSWVEDETNALNIYRRNRVRNEVMPLLAREVNPGVVEHLASLAEEAQLWRKMQEDHAAALCREVSLPRRGWPYLSLSKLRRVHEFQRRELLRFAGRRLGLTALTRPRIEELDRLMCRSGRFVFQWGSEVDVEAGGGMLCWHPAAEKRLEALQLSLGETARWGGWKVSLRLKGASAEADFGLRCPLDEARPVVLQKNTEKYDVATSFFPVISQENVFRAEKKQNRWEILHHSVKYNVVAQVVLSPLVGRWRESLWN